MNETTHLLADIETTHLVQASTGKRFANYLIDIVVFYILIFVLGILLALISPGFAEWINSTGSVDTIIDRLIGLLLYGIIMGIIEALTRGRSLGKLITGTRAVNHDGTTISTKTAFLRGLCRAVPFDTFSALSSPCYPWHDKWVNTYVIDVKQSTLNPEIER